VTSSEAQDVPPSGNAHCIALLHLCGCLVVKRARGLSAFPVNIDFVVTHRTKDHSYKDIFYPKQIQPSYHLLLYILSIIYGCHCCH